MGIVTNPPDVLEKAPLPAIVLLNSGIIHRVGLNRLHVRLARRLALEGFVVLRFDFSGVGDSKADSSAAHFVTSAVKETREAMNYLERSWGRHSFVLMGICSGALISFLTADRDSRVVGACLINGQGFLHKYHPPSEPNLRSRTLMRHYRRIAFTSSFRTKNWRKLLTGNFDYRSVLDAARGLLFRRRPTGPRIGPSPEEGLGRLESLTARGVRLLLLHSEGDEGLDYVRLMIGQAVDRLPSCPGLKLKIIKGANHIFTLRWSQEAFLDTVTDWTREFARS